MGYEDAMSMDHLAGRKIGFLGGGAMAGALIKGLVTGGRVTRDQIRASDVKAPRLAELGRSFGIETTTDNAELVQWANVIVVSVKPQIVDRVLPIVAAHLAPESSRRRWARARRSSAPCRTPPRSRRPPRRRSPPGPTPPRPT
jgi:hypothetical protein